MLWSLLLGKFSREFGRPAASVTDKARRADRLQPIQSRKDAPEG